MSRFTLLTVAMLSLFALSGCVVAPTYYDAEPGWHSSGYGHHSPSYNHWNSGASRGWH